MRKIRQPYYHSSANYVVTCHRLLSVTNLTTDHHTIIASVLNNVNLKRLCCIFFINIKLPVFNEVSCYLAKIISQISSVYFLIYMN